MMLHQTQPQPHLAHTSIFLGSCDTCKLLHRLQLQCTFLVMTEVLGVVCSMLWAHQGQRGQDTLPWRCCSCTHAGYPHLPMVAERCEQTLALLTFDRCRALGTTINVPAADQRTFELYSCMNKDVTSIRKSCGAYMFVECMAHAVWATLRRNHVTILCCPAVTCTASLLYKLVSSCIGSSCIHIC